MTSDDTDRALTKVANTPSESTLIVDLDHTLHLGNSTEDFIDSAWPKTLAATSLAALNLLKPWRDSSDPAASRDHWRVAVIVLIFPWTMLIWRWRVRHDEMWNEPLLHTVQGHTGPVSVASNGYAVAVRPRVRSRLGGVHIVARSLWCRGPRRSDKLDRVITALGPAAVADATVITDGQDDAPLLAYCRTPILVTWPDRRWRTALADAYVPLRYTVARHGVRFLRVGLIKDDIAVAVLAVALTSNSPIRTIAAVVVITLSVRCIYDLGYHENDHLKPPIEPEPKLHDSASQREGIVNTAGVALWATAGIVFAIWVAGAQNLVVYNQRSATAAFLAASVVLLELRIAFAVFNRSTYSMRRWVYPFIQVGRYGIYLVLFPANAFAFLALAGQVALRWTPYFVYRHTSLRDWPDGPWRLARLAVYALGLPFVWPAATSGRIAASAIAIIFAIRARGDLASVLPRWKTGSTHPGRFGRYPQSERRSEPE